MKEGKVGITACTAREAYRAITAYKEDFFAGNGLSTLKYTFLIKNSVVIFKI